MMKKQKKFWFWCIFTCLMIIFISAIGIIANIKNKNTNRNKKIFISKDDRWDNIIKIKQGDDPKFCLNLLERKILNHFVSKHSKEYSLKEEDLKLLHISIEDEPNFNYFIAIIKIRDDHPKYTGNIKMRFKIEWEWSKKERELRKNYWNKFLYINNS